MSSLYQIDCEKLCVGLCVDWGERDVGKLSSFLLWNQCHPQHFRDQSDSRMFRNKRVSTVYSSIFLLFISTKGKVLFLRPMTKEP
jgi:hypothetical protein